MEMRSAALKSMNMSGRALELIHTDECEDINTVDKKLSGRLVLLRNPSPRRGKKSPELFRLS
jgi:hypothetical protein